ncbi:hypothetical protein [Pantoea agglomerans]|uniref:hypothetical protein n=1 Tax=Enterobacter agglomerans TaxID=549 RepID=UPI0037CC62BE
MKIYIPPYIINKIKKINPLVGGEWDLRRPEIIIFKRILKKQLLIAQDNKCAYCGLPLDETGKTEIEHLAAKGGAARPKHVEYTFEIDNLYLACNLCNSPLKKGNKETVVSKDPLSYSNCIFKIVHPRYDIPGQHYSWVTEMEKVMIQPSSSKGDASIKMFELDSLAHSEARARLEMQKRLKNIADPAQLSLISSILGYI